MFNPSLGRLRAWGLCLLFFVGVPAAEAGSVTLVWDRSPEPDIAGYTLVYGTRPGEYTTRIDVANQTQFTLTTLADGTYYFAVQAYTYEGLTSGFSNEVIATLGTTAPPPTKLTAPAPTQPTSSCSTPDPFVSLGGGTCHNGGWLPPGMPIPGTNVIVTTAPSAPSQPSFCATPDPFVSMGGGTCYSGGWLPPGMPIPGGGSAAVAGSSAPVTTFPSAPSGPCITPDPFVALGGGTCYNGGWLPPGMPIPGGAKASPSPSPSPSPAPAPAPGGTSSTAGGCQIPDPFVTLGGGTCVNGGWLPPGMAVSGEQDAVEVSVTGTLHVVSAAEGLWMIEGDDGTVYTSPTEVPAELLVDGARVEFVGLVLPATSQVVGSMVVEILVINVQQ